MGLRDFDSIDIVLRRPPFETEECKLILLIIDSTSDLSDDDRYNLLVRKLGSYVTYVANPSFASEYPDLTSRDVIIRVLTVMPATTKMLQIDAIRSKDQTTRLRIFFDDYHAYMANVKGNKPHTPSSN